MDTLHIIGYAGLAFCFFFAYLIGNEINPKPKAKEGTDGDTQQKRID